MKTVTILSNNNNLNNMNQIVLNIDREQTLLVFGFNT